MSVHMRLADGAWETCKGQQAGCPLRFHVPDITVAEAELLPTVFLDALILAADPPTHVNEATGATEWLDAEGREHREYGLPAVITRHGTQIWYTHGVCGRGGDLPCVIDETRGIYRWYVDGKLGRAGDLPAETNRLRESFTWYRAGEIHREGNLPAVVGRHQLEWYIDGVPARTGNGPLAMSADGSRVVLDPDGRLKSVPPAQKIHQLQRDDYMRQQLTLAGEGPRDFVTGYRTDV